MHEYTAPQVQPVYQRLRAWREGQLLLDTRRAHLYFPDGRHPLWAVPADDLRLPVPGALTHDGLVVLSPDHAGTWVEEDRQTYGMPRNPYHRVDALTCQYKGEARYFRVRDSDAELWTYRHPDPEAAAIAGCWLKPGNSPAAEAFTGFPPSGIAFLAGLAADNTKARLFCWLPEDRRGGRRPRRPRGRARRGDAADMSGGLTAA